MSTQSTLRRAKGSLLSCLAAVILLLLAQAKEAVGDVFCDFDTIDEDAETATGELGGVTFTLESTRFVGHPLWDPPADGGVELFWSTLDGTSTAFDTADFTPRLPMGDALGLGAASDFRIRFEHLVSDLTLHIFECATNKLSFSSNAAPAHFTLLSSNGFFTVLDGGTSIRGTDWNPWGQDNADGSLLFSGTFSEISWTSDGGNLGDAMKLQMSVVPEPCTLVMILAGGLILLLRRRYRMR